jgi:hypothetical protein
MGLGWAGFLSGMGQGLERASGAVDQYTAAKKLAAQIAMQQAQQNHLFTQDALHEKQFEETLAENKRQAKLANDRIDGQTIKQDLTDMSVDQMPMASMPPEWQANARRFAPTQIAYQPPSLGKSTEMAEVGPSEGGDYANRFVTPGERNASRTAESRSQVAEIQHRFDQARIDALIDNANNKNDLGYYRADQAAAGREAAAAAKAEKEKAAKHDRDGQFAYSQAVRNYNSWAKDQAKDPANFGTLITPEIRNRMLGQFYQEALTPFGASPADYPVAAKQMGIDLNPQMENIQPPAAAPPAPAKPGFFERLFGSSTPPAPGAPAAAPPSALGKWLSEDPRAALRQQQQQEATAPKPPPPAPEPPPRFINGGFNKPEQPKPKVVTISELRNLLPVLAGHGIKSDKDLLNYARLEGFTVTG